ncbi:bacteriophage lambda head decoration protein D [Paenibacillus cellulosilyticus]|uniref:Bacteriophage lambda head decoration protein D n=1 Tax=Paenibacillus cellulosilyticus TaxID=375489 RepID=A0A2V2YY13_9BACL|nr:head decoration protein [Paenibacillus cellulosilyticus]PWW06326.1 bacteriophage lambda head decoration protein D [Paenibacillus cellulosilyticus]QKS42930.1 head decoration protein [Paenibacillus cellulosilyticus]QKS43457.1 head decoration protein [Paenibacillus cellulosilyticus]
MNNRPYYGAPGPGPVYTQEFIEVLASTDLQAKLPGGVLLAQGNGVVKKGTVLGKVTATQKYVPYDADASDGSQVAVCILDNDRDTTETDIGASAWIAGIFTEDKLTGIDAAAKTALKLCYFV